MHLSDSNTPILIHFQPLLTQPGYRKRVLLVMGTLSARGNRTVSTALKMLGLEQERNYSKYHNLLNRAKYSPLAVSRVLLQLLLTIFVGPNAPVEVVITDGYGVVVLYFMGRCTIRTTLGTSTRP